MKVGRFFIAAVAVAVEGSKIVRLEGDRDLLAPTGLQELCLLESHQHFMRLLETGQVKVDRIITHRLPLAEYQKGFDLLLERQAIKVMLEP